MPRRRKQPSTAAHIREVERRAAAWTPAQGKRDRKRKSSSGTFMGKRSRIR